MSNTESKERLRAVIDSAPDGATHVSENGVYYRLSDGVPYNFWVRGDCWVESNGIHHLTRALADINMILSIKANK